jgi:hypothetical protein
MKARLLILIIFLYASATGQTFTYSSVSYSNGIPAQMSGVPGDLFMTTVTFSNSTNVPLKLRMHRFQKSIPKYWAVCYCYIQCHSPADDTVTVFLDPFSTSAVSVQFKTDSVNPGVATASFKMFGLTDSSNYVNIDMQASTLGPLGIASHLQEPDRSVLLNDRRLEVQSSSLVRSVDIIDLSGAVAIRILPMSSAFTVDLSTLSPGIYFSRIDTGNRPLTKKIVVQ